MPTLLDDALLTDTLRSLPGWQVDGTTIVREATLTPEQGSELRARVQADSPSMKDGVATLHGANPSGNNPLTNRYYDIKIKK